MTAWVERWNDFISAKPEAPGVWRRRDGGFRVRARRRDPRTGKLREVNRALPDCKRVQQASVFLEAELAKIGDGAPSTLAAMPRFADWAADVFARKVRDLAIASASGRAKWEHILRLHLIPAFGAILVDRLTREDIERWKTAALAGAHATTKDAKRIRKLAAGRYSPQTANTILGVLRQITAEASREFNIRDVAADIANVSTRGHRTYTYEEPNALKPIDVPRFLAEFRVRYPEHYAFVFLGFTTGLRPSSLRPLRCSGPNADVKWDDDRLLVRRSHSRGREVMDETKTGRDQVIDLDPEQIAVLRWQVERLELGYEVTPRDAPNVPRPRG